MACLLQGSQLLHICLLWVHAHGLLCTMAAGLSYLSGSFLLDQGRELYGYDVVMPGAEVPTNTTNYLCVKASKLNAGLGGRLLPAPGRGSCILFLAGSETADRAVPTAMHVFDLVQPAASITHQNDACTLFSPSNHAHASTACRPRCRTTGATTSWPPRH